MFCETRATSFDLNSATRLLLDMLNIRATLANYLSTKIKTRNRLQVNRNPFLRPFPLQILISHSINPILYYCIKHILDRIHPVPLAALVLCDETSARQQGWAVLVSSIPLFWRLPCQDPPWWCSLREDKAGGSGCKMSDTVHLFLSRHQVLLKLTAAVAMLLSGK